MYTLKDLSNTALTAFFSRLSIPREWEELHDTTEAIVREDEE